MGVCSPELTEILSIFHGELGMIYTHLDENERAYNEINQAI
jgi:hypothetical protein